MKKNKLSLHLSLFMSGLILAGCVGETPANTPSTITNQLSKVVTNARSNDDGQLTEVDLYTLDYGKSVAGEKHCAADNSVCVVLNKTPYGVYDLGNANRKYWVQQSYLTTFTVEFNQNINNFQIKGISQSGFKVNGKVGHVEQIDTAECDALMNTGEQKGKQCRIKFNYTGDQMTGATNLIKFTFGWNKDDQASELGLEFNIANVLANNIAELKKYKQEHNNQLPIVNFTEDNNGIIYQPPGIYGNTSIITYATMLDNVVYFKNNGGASLIGSQDGRTPTINMAKGLNASGVQNSLLISYYDNLITTCADGNLATNEQCNFRFMLAENDNKKTTSQSFNFLMQYRIGELIINNIKPTTISQGSFIPQNSSVLITNNKTSQIKVTKLSLGSNDLNYSQPLKNIKLMARYNPKFKLDNIAFDDKVNYSIGTVNDKVLNWENMISKVKFDYDSKCLEDGYNPDLDGFDVTTNRACPITVDFSDALANSGDLAVLGFDLYATYDSVVGDVPVEQFLGHITASSNPNINPVPPITTNTCTRYGWTTGNQLECAQGYYGNFITYLDYGQCASNTSVSAIPWSQMTLKGEYTSGHLEFLICNEYNASYPKPNPDQAEPYTKRCFDLSSNGKTLTGKCLKADVPNHDYRSSTGWNDAILDLSECSATSTISVQDDGSLKCDNLKN